MRSVLRVAAWVAMLAGCATAFGGTGHILLLNGTGPNEFTVDLNPATSESLVFEIIVDSSYSIDVGGFEWQLGLGSAGLAFDAAASEAATNALASDSLHAPAYLLFGDSFGFDAALSVKGIRASDLSEGLFGYNPIGLSLGIVVVNVTDEAAAVGLHLIEDPESFLLLGDFETTELLTIPALSVRIIPEPGTLALLAIGLLAAVRRRRK